MAYIIQERKLTNEKILNQNAFIRI